LVDHFHFDQIFAKFLYSAFDNDPHVRLLIITVFTKIYKKFSFFIEKGPVNLGYTEHKHKHEHEHEHEYKYEHEHKYKRLKEHSLNQFFAKPLPVPAKTTINLINHKDFRIF
jgi:hypothetical protein